MPFLDINAQPAKQVFDGVTIRTIHGEKLVNNPALKHRGLCEAHAKRPLHKLNG